MSSILQRGSQHTPLSSHMAMPEVHEALDEQEIALCFPVVQTLRVHFTSQADFVSRVVRQQADGYHLMYIADGGQVQAIAGYRIREHLETPDPRCASLLDGMLYISRVHACCPEHLAAQVHVHCRPCHAPC